ncbi:MAG: putative transcriptional regulator, TetR family [Geminicoccaceae bacterium]|jgi:AcrR family transcriptional regulator|nr:putative transcriptional regulator, TetR family [Geminicoccaceae bacterium]
MSSQPARRWRRRKDARPAEIVDAALEVFAERGFSAARLDDVAARAGISKGTLYLYFPSKEELFKAVVRQALLPNLARVERLLREHPGPAAAQVELMIGQIGALLQNTRIGAIPKLIIAESGNFPELARFYLEEVIQRGLGLFATVLERGIASGELRAVDVGHGARTLVAPVLLAAIWKSTFEAHAGAELDAQAFLASAADVLLTGLRADGPG